MGTFRAAILTFCGVLFLIGALGGPPSQAPAASALTMTVEPATEPGFGLDATASLERSIESLRANATVTETVGNWYATVPLHNANSGDSADFRITERGVVHAEDEARLTEFFKCRRTGKRRTMAPGVLAMLVDVANTYPGKVIEVVSGVRAKPYGAKGSKHFVGRAIDFRVQGVPLLKVRDHMWREHRGVGVGYYPHEGFIHIDYRPAREDTAWTAPRRSTHYRYNPSWARKVRSAAEREANADAARQQADAERMANLRVW
ncbi:MAG TPA: DUF882 domain-containing protein [Kofleriaceae bacterium]|nr:DUF882 domain-containing protein [Kofleriaceae bacterium]